LCHVGTIECTKGRNWYAKKNPDATKQRDRPSIRTGCKWAVVLRGEKHADGPWTVEQVVTHPGAESEHKGHNHPLFEADVDHSTQKLALTKEQKEKITECAHLEFDIKNTLSTLHDAWPDKKFEYGRVHAAFQKTKEEMRKTTLKLSEFSEAADMLKLLQDKAEQDPGWYFAHEIDSQRRITRIFWMSPSQRALYFRYVWNNNWRWGEGERVKKISWRGEEMVWCLLALHCV
jgi:hypothetical protein